MDKNIFNEAVLTSGQKARLKERIFETDIKNEDNKAKKVFPFKTIGMIAAAFVLVVGAAMLVGVLVNKIGMDMMPPATYSSNDNNNTVASNGGADDPESVVIGMTDLKAKYPQYFELDTTKGLIVYVWIMGSDSTIDDPHTELCTLLPGKNTSYTDSEIASQQGISIPEMAQILSSYNIEPGSISVRYFEHPSGWVIFDPYVDGYISEKCRQLGVEKYTSDFNVMMNVNFKDDTQFTVSIQHSTDNCTHLPGKLYTSPEYDIYLRYNNEFISYGEYLQLTGAEFDTGEFVWETVLYYINDHEELLLEEDLSDTYGKLPVGEYFIRKEVTLETESGTNISKHFYAPFEIKEKPTIPEDEKDKVVSIVNGVEVRLGDGEFYENYDFIYNFDFAIVYDTPHNFYHDTFTENGGDIPLIFPTDENTVYKTIEVGDKLSPDFTVTEASFNCNVIKGAGNVIEGLDPKMSENRLRAEGKITVTAYAYKQKYDNGTSEVMIIIDPRKDMNGEITLYRLYRERLYDFRYVSESGGLFEAISSTPVMKLSQVDSESFDRDGLWEIELDITAIEMVYTERGGQSYISPEISDLRLINQIEVSDPIAE